MAGRQTERNAKQWARGRNHVQRKDELKASLKELISALIDGGIRYMWVSVWVRWKT